ncbi:SEL1-like repeat protein [Rhizobium gallicum]|nr:SEL1-like repeat protein [Rhizobium gallicum]
MLKRFRRWSLSQTGWNSVALVILLSSTATAADSRETIQSDFHDGVPETECDRLAAHPDDKQRLASVTGIEKPSPESVTACLAAVESHPGSPRLTYQAGRAYDAVEDYENALAYYSKASELGSASATARLGWMYESGKGVAEDDVKALKLFIEAAEAGSVDGAESAGLSFQYGWGVEKNIDKAIHWYLQASTADAFLLMGDIYDDPASGVANRDVALKRYRKAFELGSLRAAVNLGNAYEQGDGVPQDYTEAMKFYVLAAAKLGDAANEIGDLYYYGKGVAQSYPEARRWFEQGAEAGHHGSMRNLGALYEYGKGVEKDTLKAIEWYRKAAENGSTGAMRDIGYLYLNGKGVPKDLTEASRWYIMAAEKGDDSAFNQLGWLRQTSTPPDYAAAMEWYKKGAEAGNRVAMSNVGLLYADGKGVKRNYKEALAWYRKAADAGDGRAMNEIGVLYHDEKGVRQNYREAGIWYEKAAAAGNTYANLNLAALFSRGQGVRKDTALAVDLAELAVQKSSVARDHLKAGWANWAPEFLKAFQQRLIDRGFYQGVVDGRYGKGTLAAIDAMHTADAD